MDFRNCALKFLLAVVFFLQIGTHQASALMLIANCTALTAFGETYQLTQNVNATGTCFQITNNSVTLDLNGFTVRYGNMSDDGYGLYLGNQNHSIIKNGFLIDDNSTTSGSYGVYFFSAAYNNTIQNVSITTNSSSSNGIYFDKGVAPGPTNNTIANVSITIYNTSSSSAIYLRPGSNYNTITNTSGYTNGSSQALIIQTSVGNIVQNSNFTSLDHNGVAIWSSNDTVLLNSNFTSYDDFDGVGGLEVSGSYNTTVRNNKIMGMFHGITMDTSSLTVFENNTINTTQTHTLSGGVRMRYNNTNTSFANNYIYGGYAGIRIGDTGSLGGNNVNTTFKNDVILPNANYDIAFNQGNEGPNVDAVLLNVSFRNKSFIVWSAGTGNLTIKWYARANVTNRTSGAVINNAVVNVTNASSSVSEATATTDSSGLTPWFGVTEFVGNSTVNVSYTPHSFVASTSGYLTRTVNSTINGGATVLVPLSDNYDYNLHSVSVFVTGVSGNPSSSINVTVYNKSGGIWNNVNASLTNSSGYAVFYDMPSENYTFNVSRGTVVNATNETSINGTQPSVLIRIQNFVSGPIVGINMTPWAPTNVTRGNFTFVVSGLDVDGNQNNTGSFNWSSSNSTIAAYLTGNVSATGIFNASDPGSATITVISNANASVTNSTIATATPDAIVSIDAVFSASATSAGVNISANITSKDRYGNVVNDTYKFSTNDTQAVLPANGTGNGTFRNFSLITAGTAIINITSNSNSSAKNGTVATVNAAAIVKILLTPTAPSNVSGGNFTFTASGLDAYENQNNTGSFNWSSSNANISANLAGNGTGTGTFNASIAGTATITVMSNANNSVTNSTTATVTAGSIVTLRVLYSAASTAAGVNVSANITSLDAQGNAVNDTYNFSASDPQGVIPANGTTNGTFINFTLKTAGNATINVTGNGNSSLINSTIILVNISSVAQVLLVPQNPSVTVGGTVQMNVTLKDAYGNTNNSVNATFNATGTTGNGTVNLTTGLFTSTAAGLAAVSANYSNVWNTTNVTVNSAPAATPAPSSSQAGPAPVSTATPEKESTATTTPAPGEETVGEEKPVIIAPDEKTTVAGTFTSDSASFSLTYTAGSSGFAGTLTYRLPLSYADYLAGIIKFDPEPKSVREGSVIAEWDAELKANEKFEVTVDVAKPVEPAVLKEFKAPETKLKKTVPKGISATTATTTGTETAYAAKTGGEAAATPDYGQYAIYAAIILIVAAWSYLRSRK